MPIRAARHASRRLLDFSLLDLFVTSWHKGTAMRSLRVVMTGILLLSALAGMVAPRAEAARPAETMEYQLAVLDAGTVLAHDDLTVARFRSLLNQLTAMYRESREQIGESTYAAQKHLRAAGIKEKLLTIMEGLNQIRVTHIANQRYAEYLAMYVTL